MKKQTGSRSRGWLSAIGNRLSVAAGVALAAGMLAGNAMAGGTWDGGDGTDAGWANRPNNWDANTYPSWGTTCDIIFYAPGASALRRK